MIVPREARWSRLVLTLANAVPAFLLGWTLHRASGLALAIIAFGAGMIAPTVVLVFGDWPWERS